MIPCPPPQRSIALSLGLPDDDVDELWGRHCDLVDESGGGDYGGIRWKGLVQAAVKAPRLPTVKRDDPVIAAARRREREAKILEDNEYLKSAMGLGQWLAQLRAGTVAPSALECHLLAYREPKPVEDAAAWLLAAFAEGPRVARSHPCAGCEVRQAASVTREGRVYHRAQCDVCARIDRQPSPSPHAPQIGMPRNVRNPSRPKLVSDWEPREELLP